MMMDWQRPPYVSLTTGLRYQLPLAGQSPSPFSRLALSRTLQLPQGEYDYSLGFRSPDKADCPFRATASTLATPIAADSR